MLAQRAGEMSYNVLMSTKTLIYIGIAVGGLTGGCLGSLLDGGNIFGFWGIIFGTLGSFAGIWAGYKLGSSYIPYLHLNRVWANLRQFTRFY